MKVVHNSARAHSAHQWLEAGRESEKAGDLDEAASSYEKAIDANPVSEPSYHRLMIIYRKQKEYARELALIKKGIEVFTAWHKENTRLSHGGRVLRLSKALSKATGLLDKKGKELYAPQPVSGWLKRQELLEKRLAKKKAKKKS